MIAFLNTLMAAMIPNQTIGEQHMQIQPPEAVKLAKEFLLSIHSGAQNVLVEEILLTDDDNFWLVTLSYSDQSPILEIVKGKALKQVKIKTDTGEVRGMSIRKL